ncbi:MAG TPA: hypothetical protein VFN55_08200 [Solirubrobacteraceae bacterium]|nr:hypothetical protein [Solirubrobacteraceae bacterium]
MPVTHRDHVETLLRRAAVDHEGLLTRLPPALQASLPVDAQGVTQAIEHLAEAAGLSPEQRRAMIRPHAINPAVMHARVFGPTELSPETVLGSFVEGARVRAEALGALADTIGGQALGSEIRALLIDNPPPAAAAEPGAMAALRATYAAQEQAAVLIATRLDDG